MSNQQDELAKQIFEEFPQRYANFSKFMISPEYAHCWNKCLQAATNKELLGHFVFCNDLFRIPPVKSFLTYFKDDLNADSEEEKPELDSFEKRAIGAFWGYVFKGILNYDYSINTTVSIKSKFSVSTASYFKKNELP